MTSSQHIPVRDRAVYADPAAPSMPHGLTLHDLEEAIMTDPTVRAFAAKLLAKYLAQNQQVEKYEFADPDNNDVTTKFRTKNGKGKAAAATATVHESTPSTSQSATDRAGAHHRAARAAGGAAGAVKARAPSATHTSVQQRDQSTVDEPASPPSSSAAVCASVPTGLKNPNDVVSKTDRKCNGIWKYIGPVSVHTDSRHDGKYLPAQIPCEIVEFIKEVRSCTKKWFTRALYCVEYHGGTWFVAAGFFAYLHRTENDKDKRNHTDYVDTRKEIQNLLLDLKKAGMLPKISVGNDKLAPGLEAGKGGNSGGEYGTWFVRPDVDWASLAERAKLAAKLAKPANRGRAKWGKSKWSKWSGSRW
ncbi:hypothetical protein GGF32_005684 [Allomyces javanicus]|nr:hypothetical protein GGF32_005684 [Allomyces javanicus]